MALDAATRDKYEKIANLLLLDVPYVQIAAITGLSESRISQLKSDQEFLPIYSAKASEKVEEEVLLNDGWAAIETHALAGVLNQLKFGHDPEYALKAAMIANKATRRGSARANQTIPNELGQRIVLNLPENFVGRIQAGEVTTTNGKVAAFSIELAAGKFEQVLAPSRVSELLQVTDDKAVARSEVQGLMDEFGVNN